MGRRLAKIIRKKGVVAALEQEMENRQKDIDRIVEDQGRLAARDMEGLARQRRGESAVTNANQTTGRTETQLDQLRKKIQDTEKQRDTANEKLQATVDTLQLEATL